MIANLSVTAFLSYAFLNLHVFSDSNRYLVVRLFSNDIKLVKTFSWYVWRGENNKVVNEEGMLDDKWAMLDIIDFEGRVLFVSELENCQRQNIY
jgi:hypothetical protein